MLRGGQELSPLAELRLMPGDYLLLLGTPERFSQQQEALRHLLSA